MGSPSKRNTPGAPRKPRKPVGVARAEEKNLEQPLRQPSEAYGCPRARCSQLLIQGVPPEALGGGRLRLLVGERPPLLASGPLFSLAGEEGGGAPALPHLVYSRKFQGPSGRQTNQGAEDVEGDHLRHHISLPRSEEMCRAAIALGHRKRPALESWARGPWPLVSPWGPNSLPYTPWSRLSSPSCPSPCLGDRLTILTLYAYRGRRLR
jgi:hypothetical protein